MSRVNPSTHRDLELELESRDVFYARARYRTLDAETVAWLIEQAARSERKRVRICLHDGISAPIHEMLIVHHRTSYVRPHRHPRTEASLLAIQGKAKVAVFDAEGELADVDELCQPGGRAPFFYRVPRNSYYSILIETEWLVFLETMGGPFTRSSSEFGPWSPDGETGAEVERYWAVLRERAADFLMKNSQQSSEQT